MWRYFANIKNECGIEFDGLLACKMCFSALKFSGSTSNLVKHKCYNVNCKTEKTSLIETNSTAKHEAVNVVTEWVIQNCRPFKIVEDSGLKKFASILIKVGASFGSNVDVEKSLPHSINIS